MINAVTAAVMLYCIDPHHGVFGDSMIQQFISVKQSADGWLRNRNICKRTRV